MEFFFPEDSLLRMTPEETQISGLSARPYPDGVRVHVNIEITPFQKRPHIEVIILDSEGSEAASVSMVEPMSWKLEFTMHLRGAIKSPYTLEARLFYPDGPAAEPRKISFDVEPPRTTPILFPFNNHSPSPCLHLPPSIATRNS